MPDECAITFACGGDQLLGILHTGSYQTEPILIFVVGGPQYRVGSHRMFVLLARALSSMGFTVLRFDCRGMGDSDGVFKSFESISDDIRCAIDELRTRMPGRQVVLVGLCDGASACAMYAAGDSRVGALVLMNPWVKSQEGEAKARVTHYYARHIAQWEFWRRLLRGKVRIGPSIVSLGRNLRLSRKRRTDGPSNFVHGMLEGLAAFRGAVLVLLSADDLTAQEFMVLTRTSDAWCSAMRNSKVSIETIEGADHTFSRHGELEGVVSSISAFVGALVA